jgi:hypothetical protein
VRNGVSPGHQRASGAKRCAVATAWRHQLKREGASSVPGSSRRNRLRRLMRLRLNSVRTGVGSPSCVPYRLFRGHSPPFGPGSPHGVLADRQGRSRTWVAHPHDLGRCELRRGCLRSVNWCLGGGRLGDRRRRPATGQPPPATSCPASAPAAWRTSAPHRPLAGGLLAPLGHALLGQELAEPCVLVMHGSLLSSWGVLL